MQLIFVKINYSFLILRNDWTKHLKEMDQEDKAKRFGYEHYGIEPDIFTLAKGLGNGLPVGAMVAKKEYAESFGPGTHGSTFGGNPLAMAAAKAVEIGRASCRERGRR